MLFFVGYVLYLVAVLFYNPYFFPVDAEIRGQIVNRLFNLHCLCVEMHLAKTLNIFIILLAYLNLKAQKTEKLPT